MRQSLKACAAESDHRGMSALAEPCPIKAEDDATVARPGSVQLTPVKNHHKK